MRNCTFMFLAETVAALCFVLSVVICEDVCSGSEDENSQISLVLPLTLKDASRAMLLFSTLRTFMKAKDIRELLVIAPEKEIPAFAWLRDASNLPSFPIRVVDESSLFEAGVLNERPRPEGYAIQMAIKILVADLVTTPFYLTLDADVLVAAPTSYPDLIVNGRARYNPEPRAAHPAWWTSSEKLLGESARDHDGFGVTPALLHRNISRLVMARLATEHGPKWQRIWLRSFGVRQNDGRLMLWSEYTLYRTAGAAAAVFRTHHVEYPPDDTKPLCDADNVWYEDEFEEWEFPRRPPSKCFFLVVQSTSRAPPAEVSAKLLASERFGEALKHILI